MSSRVDIDREELEIAAERVVRKNGNSLSVAFPPEILQGTGLGEGDQVRLVGDMEEGTIIIKRAEDDDEAEDEEADADDE